MTDKDPHIELASKMFRVEYSRVTEEQRRIAKEFNFVKYYTPDIKLKGENNGQ